MPDNAPPEFYALISALAVLSFACLRRDLVVRARILLRAARRAIAASTRQRRARRARRSLGWRAYRWH